MGSIEGTARKIEIVDTTLRDGEQAAGVAFSESAKLGIARRLARMGVDEIEVGTPAMGTDDRATIRQIASLGLTCRLTGWCRACEEDLDAAEDAGLTAVHLSLPVSPRLLATIGKSPKWVIHRLQQLMPLATGRFEFVSVGAQDASRADRGLLRAFVNQAEDNSVDRVRLADTVGCWSPEMVRDTVLDLKAMCPSARLGIHTHNDLGMATANAVAAVQAGADSVDTTVLGLGERAGNAALEQVVMALRVAAGVDTGVDTTMLSDVCEEVAAAAHRTIPSTQPIVGSDVFKHESGIHVAAMLRDPFSYESFPAWQVGRSGSEFVIGRHSGTSSIQHALECAGRSITREQAASILGDVRREAVSGVVTTDRLGELLDAQVPQVHEDRLSAC